MKTIVTHNTPDLDAISSVWLLKRFLTGWEEAEVQFVPAGTTLDGEPADSNPEILHVDTGMGMLDHHQTDEDTCAAKRTLEFISRRDNKKFPDEALVRLTDVVNDVDHFRDVYYPNPAADFYDLSLIGALDGWKMLYQGEDNKLLELGMTALDGVYRQMQDKVWAEKEIAEKGMVFPSKWGKALAIETINDETVKLAQKQGFVLAVRKDPHKNYVRIKGLPMSKIDLTQAYQELKKMDKDATWYLHASHKMLLNGSMKNPKTVPTKLTLLEIVAVLKK